MNVIVTALKVLAGVVLGGVAFGAFVGIAMRVIVWLVGDL